MPRQGRQFRGVSTQQAIRAFERAGYKLHRSSGKHHVLKCPGRSNIVLPKARLVKPGLLLYQVKQAGLDMEQFGDLLK